MPDAPTGDVARFHTLDNWGALQIALSTDLLMGFCGESEADHLETLDLIQQVGYDQAFLFAYSERSQTHAARHLQVPT